MFGISGTELLIILFFGFLILGPEKLPQVGRTVGRAIRQFRDASEAANKKFKEEVADPFQEAIAPYKDQMEESTKPIQDDIAAISSTFNEAKSAFTDPFKDILSPGSTKPTTTDKAGAVIATGVAVDEQDSSTAALRASAQNDGAVPSRDESAESAEPKDPVISAGDDPFSGIVSDGASEQKPSGEAKPIPESGGKVKKSMAASLYDLDDAEGGE